MKWKTNKIAILMATYNGAEFISEQIDSLLAQSCQEWHLYIHDDGTNDRTLDIVKYYASTHYEKVTLLDYPPQGGACRNFLSILECVEAPYYMFCDQDDIWLSQKIELSMQKMRHKENEHPGQGVVVYADLYITDEKLNIIYDSMWRYSGTYPQYIRTFADYGGHSAIVTGCTMLFNRAARNSVVNRPAEKALMHDAWVCLCTLKEGGIIYGIKEPLVLYRQHSSNCLGAGSTDAANVGLFYRLRNIRKVLRSNLRYYSMLTALDYGSFLKYLYSKVKYKIRIKRGYY